MFYLIRCGVVVDYCREAPAIEQPAEQQPEELDMPLFGEQWLESEQEVAIGYCYDGKTFSISEQQRAQLADSSARRRAERDRYLASTDWHFMRELEGGQAVKPEIKAYRQALRDITEQSGFPFNISWPVRP